MSFCLHEIDEGEFAIKNIVLFCAAGMSTSLLDEKMRAAAKEMNFDCDIHAYGLSL